MESLPQNMVLDNMRLKTLLSVLLLFQLYGADDVFDGRFKVRRDDGLEQVWKSMQGW